MNFSFLLKQEELVNNIVTALPKADWATFALISSTSKRAIQQVPFYLLMNVMLQSVNFPPLDSYHTNANLFSGFNFYLLFIKYTESEEDFNLDKFLLRVQYFWKPKLTAEQDSFLMCLMQRFSWSLWLGLQHPLDSVRKLSQLVQQVGYHISLCPDDNWDEQLLALMQQHPYFNPRMIPFYRISVHFPPPVTRKKITNLEVILKLIPSNSKTMLIHFTDPTVWSQSKSTMLHVSKHIYNLFYDNPMMLNPDYITKWTDDLDIIIEVCKFEERFVTVASDAVVQSDLFRRAIIPHCYSLRTVDFIVKTKPFSSEFVTQYISKNGLLLKFATIEQQDDFQFVKKAVAQCGRALEFASASLKQNKELNLIALRNSGLAAIKETIVSRQFITKEVVLELALFHRGKAGKPHWDAALIRSYLNIDTLEFALQVLQINIRFYNFISSSLMRHEMIVKFVACRKPHILVTDSYLKEDKQFQQWIKQSKEPFLRLLHNHGGTNYKLIQEGLKLRFNEILLLKGTKTINSKLLKKIKKLFKDNWIPLEGSFVALEAIPSELLEKDGELLDFLIRYCDMERLYKSLQNIVNKEILMKIAKQNLLALQWFSTFQNECKKDKVFMQDLIEKISPYAFHLCSEELKQNEELKNAFA